MKLDVSRLAHTKWEYKYHIVFAPQYRRQITYGKFKADPDLCDLRSVPGEVLSGCVIQLNSYGAV